MRRLGLWLVVATTISACGGGGEKAKTPLPTAPTGITLKSSAFAAGQTIPDQFTCSGAGDSPPLSWSGVPERARELTLVVEDPDAGRFLHWTVLKIARSTTHLGQAATPTGAVETQNSAGRSGWTPPCPPKGDAPHHYVFAIYATDAPLGLGEDATPDEVRKALDRHALARGELVGRFGR